MGRYDEMSNVERTLLVRENRRSWVLLCRSVTEMAESRFVEDSLISSELLVIRAVVIFPFTHLIYLACLLPLTATFDFALYYVIYLSMYYSCSSG
jgi:hypothetical protein